MPRGRPRDQELDRRITAAVLEELGEQGYEALSFEAVARRSRASKASLYRRWTTKRDMVLAAVKDGPARQPSGPIETGECLRDDLLALVRRLAGTMCAADTGTTVMLLQAGLEDPDLCDAIEGAVGPTGARLPQSVIDAAVARGELSSGVDPFAYEEVAGAVLLLRRANGLDLTDEYLRSLVDAVLIPALIASSRHASLSAGIFSGHPVTATAPQFIPADSMTDFTIDDFAYRSLPGSGGVHLNVAVGGHGPAVVLLHGFPQTHYMWRHVAHRLTRQFTVIVPDLRGYGDSDKPVPEDPDTYSKRTMGEDLVAIAGALGFDRFGLVGHDRGALVAVRAGLDHPDAVVFLGILDVLPTLDSWAVLQGVHAKVAWHLYLMAQPAGMPEKMIAAVAPEFYASFLDAWDPTGTTFTTQERDHYVRSSIASTNSIVADYRATAGIDLDMDTADRERGTQLAMPVAVVSQDWGAQLGFDASALWRAWAPDFTYQATTSGHFMAEENPEEIADFVVDLALRADEQH